MPPILDRGVRFGAAVYGSLLAATVIGVAYESGAGTRTMTASLRGSMLVYWAAHRWSDGVDERIRFGQAFRPRDMLFIARREWPLAAAVLPSILLASVKTMRRPATLHVEALLKRDADGRHHD